MQLIEANKILTNYGGAMIAKLKYGFNTSYDRFDFFYVLEQKKAELEKKTYNTLYTKQQ